MYEGGFSYTFMQHSLRNRFLLSFCEHCVCLACPSPLTLDCMLLALLTRVSGFTRMYYVSPYVSLESAFLHFPYSSASEPRVTPAVRIMLICKSSAGITHMKYCLNYLSFAFSSLLPGAWIPKEAGSTQKALWGEHCNSAQRTLGQIEVLQTNLVLTTCNCGH